MDERQLEATEDAIPVLTDDSEDQEDQPRFYYRLPFSFAKRHGVFVGQPDQNHGQIVYYKESLKPQIFAEVNRYVEGKCRFEVIEDAAFEDGLAKAYQNDSTEAMQMVEGLGDDMDLASLADSVPETEDLLEQEDDAPIIRLINAILTEAVKTNASDIHIETFEKDLVVRFRVDGVLREMVKPKRALAPLLVSRIKVMSRLDIAEKRIPQDGRISLRVAGKEVDIRVSTMPSANGERIVLRLLDKQAGRLKLEKLGMADRDFKLIKKLIHRPHGIILVTGPTGSGKTTSLYAGLSEINDRSRNILTVEDPIEYNLPGIGQTQVNTKVDMTFARGLRAILRQDPDVVMIGEIRDLETAEIAVQASLTGHLVLSTLHTNSAVGAVTRLMDMGVEPFLISSSLIGVIAQRLVRVLCDQCKEAYTPDDEVCEFLGIDPQNPQQIYHAKGCADCNHLGYRGRLGIYEVIEVDEELRHLVHKQAGEMELEACARKRGPSIHADGIAKVLKGLTSVEEVVRVTHRE
ncbi:type II secretion system ATPase GspE [Hahella aquimaris]|uniref:type II secretion system ATPase GspE n=1 Tax=Hahella sp. HNIBRBA332 TaxID=3015983 RepID=UPI00273AD76C|nr:type II secretion system ATPase GspE [Hahella sp. HNIBRBA332]WLQ15832.1 type II secretion system ATPase GspE [Hahella sp. HNIBRBA332]